MLYYLQKNLKNTLKKQKIKNYDINEYVYLNVILGYLSKKGNKNLSYFYLTNLLFQLKKVYKRKLPRLILNIILNRIKPYVLLLNKRKGTILFELPRFITIEKSNKKAVEWLIKVSRKRKKEILNSILIEIKDIYLKKGDVLLKNKQISSTIKKNRPFFYLLKKRKK
jgi:ribosomal protein S7